MKRCVLCGLVGVAAVLAFLAVMIAHSPPAEARPCPPPASVGGPLPSPDFPSATVGGSIVGAPRKEPAAKTIDELLSYLDAIKAQKAQLEKQEKEVVALLAEKLKEQQQRLQKLGIQVDGIGAPVSVTPAPYCPTSH